MNGLRQLWTLLPVFFFVQARAVDQSIGDETRLDRVVVPIHSVVDTVAVDPAHFDSAADFRSDSGSGVGVEPSSGPRLAGKSTHTDRGHFRVGLHGSRKDVGLLMGCAIGWGRMETGVDFWIRPGLYVQEIQMTPTHRAQYKELLYGAAPWVEYWLFPKGSWDLGLVSSWEVAGGDWYGTSKGPGSEAVAAFGLKIAIPSATQFALRRSISDGLLGPWRGEFVCEF